MAVIALSAVGALMTFSDVRADGEAGVVIQDGDAVATYCIAFTGDGITGDQLLKAAGQTFDAYGGGSGLAVCSISGRGCDDASSFTSCFCQCQGGSCTYWAFFTRGYSKNWVYSSLAFNLLKAKDGDVHGWKWGQGGPNNAPAPQDITFEQICGHSPQGRPATPATPTTIPTVATLLPTVPPTLETSTNLPQTTGSPTASVTPLLTTKPSGPANTPLVTLTGIATTAASSETPVTPRTDVKPETGDSSKQSLLGFGAIALVMLGAIGAAMVWRSKRG